MKILRRNVDKQELKEFLYYGMNLEDKELYNTLNKSQANVFQFSGNTAAGMIQRAKPSNFDELTACNSLSRPGSSFSFDDYCANGTTHSKYPEAISKYLKDTHGCILFQEQIMRIVEDLSHKKIKGDYCFTGDSLVETENGKKKIKDLTVGEKVVSYNETTKETELKEVVNFFNNGKKKVIKIVLDNDRTIECTPDHKFLTKNRGWVEAINLTQEDDIVEL